MRGGTENPEKRDWEKEEVRLRGGMSLRSFCRLHRNWVEILILHCIFNYRKILSSSALALSVGYVKALLVALLASCHPCCSCFLSTVCVPQHPRTQGRKTPAERSPHPAPSRGRDNRGLILVGPSRNPWTRRKSSDGLEAVAARRTSAEHRTPFCRPSLREM